MQNFSRRQWLKTSGLAALSFPLLSPNLENSQSAQITLEEIIKLSSNENPYGPSNAAKEAILKSLNQANRYPNALRKQLREVIAEKEGLHTDQILLSAGSTEILSILGKHLARLKGHYVTTETTFPVLMMCTEAYDWHWDRVPLDNNFRVDLNQMKDKVSSKTKAIYLCNPNNPTGTFLHRKQLLDFCKEINPDTLIIIDEAYIEYTERGLENSMVQLLDKIPSLIIVRTYSKMYGLA
ncbi:MAG: aminotransferase class I/II-fold pyridoxal phosphate-dependent enzyme, partial [Bacteroidota bacterium]